MASSQPSPAHLPQTLAAAQTRKRNRKPYAGCYSPACSCLYFAVELLHVYFQKSGKAANNLAPHGVPAKAKECMSPSSNPQERFTQPLLINPSRGLRQLSRCGKLFSRSIFFSWYKITRSIAGPGLELCLCRITHQFQFSQQIFFRSRRNLGRPSDDFEDFDKLLLMLHFQNLQEFGRYPSLFAVGPDSGRRESNPAPWGLKSLPARCWSVVRCN